METTNHHDLSERLQAWRHDMRAAGLSSDRVAELEAHLLDAMDELRVQGHPAEAAFIEASARIGSGAAIRSEFAKADAQRRVPPLLFVVSAILILGGLQTVLGPAMGVGSSAVFTLVLGLGLLLRWRWCRYLALVVMPLVATATALLTLYFVFGELPADPAGFRLIVLNYSMAHPGVGQEWKLAVFCGFLSMMATGMHWALLRPKVGAYFARR